MKSGPWVRPFIGSREERFCKQNTFEEGSRLKTKTYQVKSRAND